MIPKNDLQRRQLALWHRRHDPAAVVEMLDTLKPAMNNLASFFGHLSGMDFEELKTECIAAFLRYLHAWDSDGKKTFFGFYYERMKWQLMAYTKMHQGTIKIPMRAWAKGVRGQRTISLDQPLRGPQKKLGATLIDIIPDDRQSAAATFSKIALRDEVVRLRLAIESLPPRLRGIMEARLEERTLKEIGEEIGLTRERVRQLEEDAMHRLRRKIRAAANVKKRNNIRPKKSVLIERPAPAQASSPAAGDSASIFIPPPSIALRTNSVMM